MAFSYPADFKNRVIAALGDSPDLRAALDTGHISIGGYLVEGAYRTIPGDTFRQLYAEWREFVYENAAAVVEASEITA